MLQLIACPVEQLGIELPEGGAEAISHEDLRRDVRLLLGADPGATFLERLAQMQMAPVAAPAPLASGAICAARGEGGGPDGRARILVAPWPGNADEATAAAALISIAKAWDLEGGPMGRATLCLAPQGERSASHGTAGLPENGLWIGPIAVGELVWTDAAVHTDAIDAARPPERINYTELQTRTKAIFRRL